MPKARTTKPAKRVAKPTAKPVVDKKDLDSVLLELYSITAEIAVADSVLWNSNALTKDLDCQAGSVIHGAVERLKQLYNDLDSAIVAIGVRAPVEAARG